MRLRDMGRCQRVERMPSFAPSAAVAIPLALESPMIFSTTTANRKILLALSAFCFFTLLPQCRATQAQEAPQQVDIQADWKRPDYEGPMEYRCWVKIPQTWQGRELQLFVEGADDARLTQWNGVQVASQGEFPPAYRSGLGETGRHPLPVDGTRFGDWNELSIRVYRRASRDNFNVAAPAVFAGNEAIRLNGNWYRMPDRFPEGFAPTGAQRDKASFTAVQSAEEISKVLQQLDNEAGPQTPAQTMQHMEVANGLQVDLALAEPAIGQPLSIKFDSRGRMWLVEYLQYPSPAGLKIVSRDKFLRTVYDKTPLPPPHQDRGADRISIHEDRDRDGVFETHSVFVDQLNMVSSFAFAKDGVYVLNPPYLLFYPDKNHDDQPDGDPEVLLEGFGLEDSHSITNSLRWGPDGWLYATQGSTVSGNVRHYGTDEQIVHTMGQLVWRYHPPTRRYEVFAEGGGNAFGLELDRVGRFYSGHNGGDTRGFHYVQGGYFQKSFGKHGALSNPFTFGYFPWMKHHSAPRFSHTFVIEEGWLFPKPFAGRLFGVEPLQSRVIMSDVLPDGSTFQTKDVGYAFVSNDTWVRPVDIQLGPDGALYVADFYEQRIDHSSHYQGRVDKSSGRIYRIRPTAPEALSDIDPLWDRDMDLKDCSSQQLIAMLGASNRWTRQTALRLIGERQDSTIAPECRRRLGENTTDDAVWFLWAWYRSGGLNSEDWIFALEHESPHVRRWAARLIGDTGHADPIVAQKLIAMSASEPVVEVRSQLASTARRLTEPTTPPGERNESLGLQIAERLCRFSGDLEDPHLPLLIWWTFEARANLERDALVAFVHDKSFRLQPLVNNAILPRLMRRYAATGRRVDLETCARLLAAVDDDDSANALLSGFDQAFEGRLMTNLPAALAAELIQRRGESIELRLQQGDLSVLPKLHEKLNDPSISLEQRVRWIALLGQLADPSSFEFLWEMTSTERPQALREATWQALRGFDKQEVARRAIETYSSRSIEERRLIESLLASRNNWSQALLEAVANGTIPKDVIDLGTIDTISLQSDPQLNQQITAIWGARQATSAEELQQRVDHYQQVLAEATGNPYTGRKLFLEHCGKCHKLFTDGGDIGPDLTSYQRDDPYRMLANVLNPSLEIREGFETTVVITIDGLTITGFVADRDPQHVVIRQPDGQSAVIAEEDIEEIAVVGKSIMPERILNELSDQQVRDLFAYLRSTQPLPD